MAYCANCGNELQDQAVVCLKCGHPRSGGSGSGFPAVGAAPRRTEGTAIASLILGIAGFVVCPLIPSILAIIFGNQAKAKISADPTLEGEGLAQAGVVLGWIGIALMGVVLIFAIIAAMSGAFTTFGPGF